MHVKFRTKFEDEFSHTKCRSLKATYYHEYEKNISVDSQIVSAVLAENTILVSW